VASKKVGVDTMKVNTGMGGGNEKVRLVQLWNPWGTFEWKGD
jgi:hypothetical protein